MGGVTIRCGDLFDGPSDLIVLPCSTGGTVTQMVRSRLARHDIGYPNSGMDFGDVHLFPFDRGENIAQFVAFAASVKGNSSSAQAVSRIGTRLGEFSNTYNSIRKIAAPLLGTGAGGLDPLVSAECLADGFKRTSHSNAIIEINVLHQSDFNRISEILQSRIVQKSQHSRNDLQTPPRVFISYSQTSPEHKNWVIKFATYLRNNGVDARLDHWHLRPGMDLPQFMTNELTLASRVILVSDERYAEKANGRMGGVGWETMIIFGEMYWQMSQANQLDDSNKYLIVARSAKLQDGLPNCMKGLSPCFR